MTKLNELIKLVNKANRKQLWFMIYDFEMIGFYREDRRQQRGFIIECLNSCYNSELKDNGCYDCDSYRMERAILSAMK